MSGGLAPIGAVIATAPIATSMEENEGPFTRPTAGTRAASPRRSRPCADLKANRPRLLAGVAEMSEYFRVRLLQLEFDRPAAVRIQGLAIGIDVGDEDYADTIHDKCRRNGLLVSTEGSTVLLLAVAGDRQADRRERTGHSGALDMMPQVLGELREAGSWNKSNLGRGWPATYGIVRPHRFFATCAWSVPQHPPYTLMCEC
jgi:hypothetical protein